MIELKINILLIGDTDSGKNQILSEYISPENIAFGIDYEIKQIVIDKYKINLYILDAYRQDQFKTLAINYLKNANGLMFIYDITSHSSFRFIKERINEVQHNGNYKSILCGNSAN